MIVEIRSQGHDVVLYGSEPTLGFLMNTSERKAPHAELEGADRNILGIDARTYAGLLDHTDARRRR